MKIADAALEVMREQNAEHCWYGTPDLVCEIYERAKGKKWVHPLNKSMAVVGALARSEKFEFIGEIEHMGRHYPVYRPRRIPSPHGKPTG